MGGVIEQPLKARQVASDNRVFSEAAGSVYSVFTVLYQASSFSRYNYIETAMVSETNKDFSDIGS